MGAQVRVRCAVIQAPHLPKFLMPRGREWLGVLVMLVTNTPAYATTLGLCDTDRTLLDALGFRTRPLVRQRRATVQGTYLACDTRRLVGDTTLDHARKPR